jgi:hypothetical protein
VPKGPGPAAGAWPTPPAFVATRLARGGVAAPPRRLLRACERASVRQPRGCAPAVARRPSPPLLPPRDCTKQARAAAGLPVPREDSLRLAVRHVPLHLAALDGSTFVLPAAGAAVGMAA